MATPTGPALATALSGIPVVQSTTDRGTQFPTPAVNQRVQNLSTGHIERWTGTRWVTDTQSPPGVFNVMDPLYGAIGDGVTDDTAARDAALAAARAAGGVLYHPPGTYKYTTPLYIKANDRIHAADQLLVTFNFVGCHGIMKDPGVATADYVELSGFTVQAGTNAGTSTYTCLDTSNMSYSVFRKITLQFGLIGLNITRGASAAACFFNTYQNFRIQYCKTGVSMKNVATVVCNAHKFYDIHVEDVGVWTNSVGFDIEGYGHRWLSCYAGGMTSRGVILNNISGDQVWLGLYIESNPTVGIDVPNTTSSRMGNMFLGVHFDGFPGTKVNDPNSEITVLDGDAFTFDNRGVSAKILQVLAVEPYLSLKSSTGGTKEWRWYAGAGGVYGSGHALLVNQTDGTSPIEVHPGAATNLLMLENDGLHIGNGTATFTKAVMATVTWDPPSLAAGAQQTTTITVTGAALGNTVMVSFSNDLAGTTMVGQVSAPNTVTVVHRNGTAGAVDLASGTLRAVVWQH